MSETTLPASRKQAVLIVNTRSRRGREWFRLVADTLDASGFDLCRKLPLRDPLQVIAETQKAVKEQVPLVIVGGGDGTMSSVARFFVESESVLGVLPLGTGNQFARDLGIVAEVETACAVLVEGRVARVDTGVVGDDYFLNVATVGLTTRIAEELTVDAKRRLGRLVYLFALTRALRRVRPFRARLEMPEGTETFETLQVVIGNGRFHAGPFPLAPDASITDGRLNIYALTGTSRMNLLRYALRLPGGHHVEMQEVHAFSTLGGKLDATPTQRVVVDGEIEFRTPVRFSVLPGALRVMVPQDFQTNPLAANNANTA